MKSFGLFEKLWKLLRPCLKGDELINDQRKKLIGSTWIFMNATNEYEMRACRNEYPLYSFALR
jgi:hypothetical protein